MRIALEEASSTLENILISYGFSKVRAVGCARLFVQASLDGVPSHGLDRFPVFLDMIRKQLVVVEAEPTRLDTFGVFERWNGNLGPGPLNALHCMDCAIAISKELGVGVVALQNTNHWMRAGNYGWLAANAGVIGICFTNTKPNMPAWGGSEPKLGNNPLVVAIPRKKGPIVLDMAMSQFSYGKMNSYLRDGKNMPYQAGFDPSGGLTTDPENVITNELALPIGLWKGSGLSLVLDMLATLLSGGKSVSEIANSKEEYGLSQVFICIDPDKLGIDKWSDEKLDAILSDLSESQVFEGKSVRYPGEHILEIREKNKKEGIPVAEEVWQAILKELK